MKITSAQYQRILVGENEYQNTAIKAVIDGQEYAVGIDPGNRHYAEIMRLVEIGESVISEPADEPS